jgi:hypothetical protein
MVERAESRQFRGTSEVTSFFQDDNPLIMYSPLIGLSKWIEVWLVSRGGSQGHVRKELYAITTKPIEETRDGA